MTHVLLDPVFQYWSAPWISAAPRASAHWHKWLRVIQATANLVGKTVPCPATPSIALLTHRELHHAHRLDICPGISSPELHYVCTAESLIVEGRAQEARGGSLPQGSVPYDPWSLSQDSAKVAPDSDVVGPASGVAWSAPRQFSMQDLKRLRIFVVGDSSCSAYEKSGACYDLEEMFREMGWDIIFEARRGEGPPQWAGLLRSYVELHKEFLVRDGAGGLQFPPGVHSFGRRQSKQYALEGRRLRRAVRRRHPDGIRPRQHRLL